MQRVLCIGSATKDIFFPTEEGMILRTPEDITAQIKVAFEAGGKFRAKERYESLGGVAANVAVGLARLGIDVACYSRIGHDISGQEIEHQLQREGVDTSCLEKDAQAKSDLSAIIVIQQLGDRIIFHNRDASEKLIVSPVMLRGWNWYHVSALNGAWQTSVATIRAALHEQGARLALNPGQHNLKDDPRLLLSVLQDVSVLFLNKDEAIELLVHNHIERDPKRLNDERFLIQTLHQYGPAIIALTDGKRGAWASDGKKMWHAPSYEPNGVVDTTGGGDAFGSGFFAAYLKGMALETCLRFGVVNAGSVVGAYGAISNLLTEETLSDLLNHTSVSLISSY